MDRSFEPLGEADVRRLGEQLDRARDFARAFDPRVGAGRPTLESLDRALEAVVRTDGPPGDVDDIIQAVAAAFGAELVETFGFRWVVATDDYGTGQAVLARPGQGDVTIFPAEFVAKRVEGREIPFLVAAVAEIGQVLREVAAEWGE